MAQDPKPPRMQAPLAAVPMENGHWSTAWQQFFQKVGDQTDRDLNLLTAQLSARLGSVSDKQITVEEAIGLLLDKQDELGGRQAAVEAQMAQVASSVVRWEPGSIVQTARPMDANWLPCDGSQRQITDYPALAPLLAGGSGPGAQNEGRFILPSLPDFVGPSGQTELRYWIRAR